MRLDPPTTRNKQCPAARNRQVAPAQRDWRHRTGADPAGRGGAAPRPRDLASDAPRAARLAPHKSRRRLARLRPKAARDVAEVLLRKPRLGRYHRMKFRFRRSAAGGWRHGVWAKMPHNRPSQREGSNGGNASFPICPAPMCACLQSGRSLPEARTPDAAPISALPLVGRQAEEYPRP